MSIPYSTRLAVAGATSGSFVTLGTVPAGKRWIIREVTVYQEGSGSGALEVRISGVNGRLFKSGILTQDQFASSSDRHLVVNAAEVVSIRCTNITGTVNANVQIHGYELDAP